MAFRERLRRTRSWIYISIGAGLPQELKYRITIYEIAKATRTSKNIPATPLDEVLQNLDAGGING